MRVPVTTILLIEDDEEDVLLLKKHLSKISGSQYKVVWATSYEEGLVRMQEGGHDLCLLDYRLGARNGIELVSETRSQGYLLPIVLLTGAGESEIDIQALQAGADDYLDKRHLQGELLYRVIRYAIERKKAELERERLLRQQIESQEIDKKRSEFIGMVVHELKTPLTSLKGYTQLLQKRCARTGDEQTMHLAGRMDTQINKLTQLIDDFQDVTRLAGETFHFHEALFFFDELVEETVEELQLTTLRQIIQLELESSHIQVWGDRIRVGQVITNFLTNAIKYAPKADCIIVKARADAQKAMLLVQDFGPGVPKEQQKKIFTAFYRSEQAAHSAIPGLGLGLHVAAEIIKHHQGAIWVESEEGKGATFCFALPFDWRLEDSLQAPFER